MPKQACLYHRLRLCPAPCIGNISAARYKEIIEEIKMFIDSEYEGLIDTLSRRMKEASREARFEEAARIRDQINALNAIGNSSAGAFVFNELEDLRQLLGLKKIPQRIEAFDISNIQGKSPCGSMVSFFKGCADKDNYRRFRIKTVRGIDDYKMLAEVLSRRYSRVIKEGLSHPDLILIDGGRQHLSTALKELDRLRLDIPVVSIAKDKENIYVKDSPGPIRLSSDTAALNLIRRIRDEAHRFAVSYHRLLRKRSVIGK
jgi:excinuclease ABC subunit C